MARALRDALGRLLGGRVPGGGAVNEVQVPSDHRMVTGDGKIVMADTEQHAAWLAVEKDARPFDEGLFPWPRILTLSFPYAIDPDVYLPGSAL